MALLTIHMEATLSSDKRELLRERLREVLRDEFDQPEPFVDIATVYQGT